MNGQYDVIVIGAGHNGLTTAAYLGKAGQRVLVLERREVLGGASASEAIFPGFTFDTGAHRVGGLHPSVVRDLQLARHGVEIIRTDPSVFAPTLDGRYLLLWRDLQKTVAAIANFSKTDADRWPRFVERMGKATEFLAAVYSGKPLRVPNLGVPEIPALLRLGGRLRRLGRLEMAELVRLLPMPVAELLDEWFETDVLKGTLGAPGVTGLFQGPMAAGTAFVMLHHHVASENGTLRPTRLIRGGMGVLVEALATAARQAGVEIKTATAVERVTVKDGRATGVVLEGGDEISAQRVVSNADPKRTLLAMLDPIHLDTEFVRKVQNIKMRGACAKVHLVLGELPSFKCIPGQGEGEHLRGVISIAPGLEYLERAYDDAKYGDVSQHPYLEVLIPSVIDPSVAPRGAGEHVMSIFVQYAPYHLAEGTWDNAKREALGDRVVATLAEYAPNIESAILHRDVVTPLDLERVYGLTEGSINHGELTLDQLYFMRPVPGWARYRTPIQNLYLCGAGTHPGGGVTGAPGYNAAQEILRDIKSGRS